MSTFFTLADLKTTPLKNTPVNFVKVYVKEKNLKYLNAAGEELDVVLDRPLENFTLPGTASPVTSSDTIATALGKIQATLDSATGIGGTSYVYVAASGTDVENAAELQAAYTTAKTMSPSATNRITIVAAPGYYNFGSTTFELDTAYIDLVSLDGNRSIIFNSSDANGTIAIVGFSISDVYVKGVDVQNKPFKVEMYYINIVIENCKGGNNSFSSTGGFNMGGKFIDCEGGDNSFGGIYNAQGIFTRCKGGANSFGTAFGSQASGTFIDCQAGISSFGGGGATASGTFNNCKGGDNSFGGNGGNASGTFTNCVGGNGAFGNFGGTLSGQLYYCRLTTGAYQTVSGAGVTRLCLDGSNVENNQG
jgi:hypothetical protein